VEAGHAGGQKTVSTLQIMNVIHAEVLICSNIIMSQHKAMRIILCLEISDA
jgi:hypothetical protein